MHPTVAPAAQAEALRDWFLSTALPLWAERGVDHAAGGFYEKLGSDLAVIEEPRRARLAARQIYVFAAGAGLGWQGPADKLVHHGLQFLDAHLVKPEARVRASCTASGISVDDRELLYDVAFVLLAYARAAAFHPSGSALEERARRIATRIAAEKGHPLGGYLDELDPGQQCANPHMHLFEAFLAWTDLPGADTAFWRERADGIARLALDRMILPDTGALPEHYDADWQPVAEGGALLIEPGHQFEWSWLLTRWGLMAQAPDALSAGARLAELAEQHGVDPDRNVAFHALDEGLRPRDLRAKLWPQTERIKAWHLQALLAQDATAAVQATAHRDRAIDALARYVAGPHPGLWYEEMTPAGSFEAQPVKASSGYHIACAIETLFQPGIPGDLT